MTAAAASNWGLITNIVNSIVGVSVLTMPFCFKQCGIVLGALLLVFCSWMTHQSCMFLVKAASLSKRRTYAGLALHAYGKAGKMLVETSMIGLMLGTCIAFYVVIGDLGSNFFARLFGFQVTGASRVLLLFAVSLCVVLPLSLQRNVMASVQSFSAMALIFYAVFVCVIMLSSLKHGLFGGQWLRRVSYIRWEGVFRCIPIFGMSFACQSQVLPTYDSLDEPSVKAMSSIFASSLNVVTTFYVMVGFFGYVSFTEATAGNVLMHFPSNLVTEMIRVGFMMSVAVGFPMMILPCRQALNTLLFEQQVVLWVGLGILVVSTHTTLSVSQEAPVDLAKEAPGSRLGEAEGAMKAEAAQLPGTRLPGTRLSGQNPIVDVAEDSRDKPKLPNEKDEMEQAQIKGPVNLPPREDAREKQEEAQLDRPGQGVVVPLGEAHRHEPPVPHDKVVVDEGQDPEGLEKEHPSKRVDERALGGKGQMVLPLLDSERERPRQDQALEAAGGLPKDPQKVPEENGQPAVEPLKEDLGLGDRGAHPGPQAVLPEGQDVLVAGAGAIADGALLPGHAVGAMGKLVEKNEHGGKARLPEEKPGPGAVPQAEPREQRTLEGQGGDHAGDHAGSKLEEAGRVEMLDHAVLLQVIKEQQVQQKRLLDQQEKLLAVIEEQHKEIHQQRQDGEDADVQPELGVAGPRGKEQEAHAVGMAERPPPQPLGAVLGAPGRPPAPPQGHSQHSVEKPEGALGRAPAAPPGGADLQPRAAQAEPREGRRGAVPEAVDAGVQERVPVLDPARAPGSPEQHGAGDVPRQSRNVFGGGSHERKKSGKEEAATGTDAQEADVLGAGAAVGAPQVKSQQASQDRAPGGLSSRSGGAAPRAQAVLHQPEQQAVSAGGQGGQQGGHKEARKEHVPAPREDAAIQEPEQRPDPELGPKAAMLGDQKPDNAKPNRDLKVQAGSDLRRRRRDVAPRAEAGPAPEDRAIVSFSPLPDVQVSDLRSALEARLRQAAGGALRVVPGRQIKQLLGALDEP
ncbi:putative sodium-coupled neutral amino acid transporter 10 isoform X5 [Monodon monoceros]|uniref:putative sodium-coupled neutral amino acid transporter 10 isoform X5 n=1 Tax=Monodon monoceros TaxID=40151 RepID=UPI0010F7242D|nr:putative sodium-coupled neutral amino acid transporter 10 isoform X5 [Monodon monoceros]